MKLLFRIWIVPPIWWSPSMRREWIEMPELVKRSLTLSMSPSMRREWIEMRQKCIYTIFHRVSLHAEGVD